MKDEDWRGELAEQRPYVIVPTKVVVGVGPGADIGGEAHRLLRIGPASGLEAN